MTVTGEQRPGYRLGAQHAGALGQVAGHALTAVAACGLGRGAGRPSGRVASPVAGGRSAALAAAEAR